MNAGALNRRIQVQRFTETGRNGFGETVGDWLSEGPLLFASRRDVSDAEKRIGGGWDNKLVTRFTIRSSPFARSIRRTDRLSHEGVTFEIDGIKEVPPGRAFIEITAWTGEVL